LQLADLLHVIKHVQKRLFRKKISRLRTFPCWVVRVNRFHIHEVSVTKRRYLKSKVVSRRPGGIWKLRRLCATIAAATGHYTELLGLRPPYFSSFFRSNVSCSGFRSKPRYRAWQE